MDCGFIIAGKLQDMELTDQEYAMVAAVCIVKPGQYAMNSTRGCCGSSRHGGLVATPEVVSLIWRLSLSVWSHTKPYHRDVTFCGWRQDSRCPTQRNCKFHASPLQSSLRQNQTKHRKKATIFFYVG